MRISIKRATQQTRQEKEREKILMESAQTLQPNDNEYYQRLMMCLGDLPPQMRFAFLLNRFKDRTYPQIAETFGISARTVEKYIAQALVHLKESLKHQRDKTI